MINIYVDADACPVKEEVLKVADRHQLEVYLVSNMGLQPIHNPRIHRIKVDITPDAADNWIIEHAQRGDIAITADILLARRCVENGVYVISPSGKIFSDNNIGNIVATRNLHSHLRETGEISGNNPSFTKQDRSRFLQVLENTIQLKKRH